MRATESESAAVPDCATPALLKPSLETEKLKELTEIFYGYYKSYDKESYNRFAKYSEAKGEGYPEIEVSKILIESVMQDRSHKPWVL